MNSNLNAPDFCFITPIPLLEQFASQSSKHLCLAHLVDSSNQYASFYRRMRERGDYVIIDNSAFELGQSYEPQKLIQLGHKCKANAIVLPDYPGQESIVTIEAAKRWIPLFKDNGFDTFFVPQSKVGDLSDWLRAYDFATTNPDIDIIGMSILGIPNALPKISRTYARVVMTQLLQNQQRFANKKHHYLGLNSGVNLEVPSLLNMNALWSVDSSGPVWSGANGIRYDITTDSYMPIAKPFLREVDFDYDIHGKEHIVECIQHNINLTKALFK